MRSGEGDEGDEGDDTIVETGDGRSRDSARLVAGASVDRFVILSEVGEGGIGRVYAAYDPELDRQIAIKLLKRAPGPDDETEVARVRREAQALAKITHPNVVTVYDVGEHEGRLYLAMEFVAGQTLRAWVKDRRPRWREVLATFVAAGQGLLAVHEAGLVHRDVKPDNVMLGDDGRVRLMDFGLAREGVEPEPVRERETGELRSSTTLTRTGTVAGTPAYMAPEQHLGLPFDARADQFAYCVALWEMLYGERPFAGDNLGSLVLNVTSGKRRPPPSDSAVPSWVRRVLERGLATDRDERFPSLAELLAALARDPAARRRRVLGVGAAAAAVVALAWWRSTTTPALAPVDPCAEVERVDSVWDPDSSPGALAAGFERSGSPLAATAAERASRGLGAWAQEWNAARRDTCEATHVRREQSEALMDLRIACLDRHRARTAGIVEALRDADAELVVDAPSIVAKLEPLAVCSDPERLRAATPPPTDPQTAALVDELALRIASLTAAVDTGRTEALLPEARTLAVQADATGHAPLRFEAAMLVASVEESELAVERCVATTRAAYFLALESGLTEAAAEAAVEMLYRTSVHAPLEPSLELWSEHARVLVARVEPEGMLEARRLINVGIIEWNRGDIRAAVTVTREAIAIAERALGPRTVTVADYRNNLGYMLSLLGEDQQALEQFELTLAIWSETLGPEHPRVAVATLSLAEIALDQDRLDDARGHAERALRLLVDADEGEGPNAAYALNLLGEIARRTGRLADAREQHERALALSVSTYGADHWRTGQALAGLGQLALVEGDTDEAIARLTAAAEIFAPLGSHKRLHGQVSFGLARAELSRGRTDEARSQAALARERFVEVERRGARELAELDAWLAQLDAPATAP